MIPRSCRSRFFLLAALAASLPRPSAAADADPGSLAAQVTVTLIQIEVRVEDGKGEFVRGLTLPDFEVLEDGVAQKLQYVDEVTAPVGPVPMPDLDAPAPAVTPEPRPRRRERSSLIVLVDRASSGQASVRRQREYLEGFLDGLAGTETIVGVFEISPGGGFKMLSDFSTNLGPAKRAVQGLKSASGGGGTRRSNFEALESVAEQKIGNCDMTPASQVEFCLEAAYEGIINAAKNMAQEERTRSEASMDSMRGVLRFADHLPGVKSMLLVSEGVDPGGLAYFNRAAGIMRYHAQNLRTTDPQRYINELMREVSAFAVDVPKFEQIRKAALASGVTVHWVNPAHDDGSPASPEGALGAIHQVGTEIAEAASPTALMKGLADDTGGLSLVRAADLKDFFSRLAADLNTYYVLSFTPTREVRDGAAHDVKVRVSRPGLRVRARKSYVDKLPEERVKRTLASALDFPDMFNTFDLPSSLLYLRQGPDRYHVRFGLAVPYAVLTPEPRGELMHDELHFGYVVRGKDGEPLVAANPRVDIDQSLANFTRLVDSRSSFDYRHGFDLAPGDYTLTAAVLDASDLRTATRKVDLKLPDGSGGCLTTPPLWLAQSAEQVPERVTELTMDEAGNARWADLKLAFPSLLTFGPTGKLSGLYQVLDAAQGADGTPSVEIFFRLFREGAFVNQTKATPLRAYTDAGSRSITSFFSVPYSRLDPGRYRIELYAQDLKNGCSSVAGAEFTVVAADATAPAP